MDQILNYIAGKLQKPISNNYLDNINPAEGKVYSSLPDSDFNDVQKAVEAASNAFPMWSTMLASKRAEIL